MCDACRGSMIQLMISSCACGGSYICFPHALKRRCWHCISWSALCDSDSQPAAFQRLKSDWHSQLSASFSQVLAHEHSFVSPAWKDQA